MKQKYAIITGLGMKGKIKIPDFIPSLYFPLSKVLTFGDAVDMSMLLTEANVTAIALVFNFEKRIKENIAEYKLVGYK